MQATSRLTVSQRDRALGRLHDLTLGAAVAGVAGLGVLGFAAAVTHPAAQATNDAALITDGSTSVTDGSTSVGDVSSGTDATTDGGSTGTSTGSGTTSSGSRLQPSRSGGTSSTRRAHASTGGS
jgi:hypothetical protein